jgi:NADH-quinone oxidoreductase subunit G
MCDSGRLNYRWIGRADRLRDVLAGGRPTSWKAAVDAVAARLASAPAGSVAIVASARQTTEELYLLAKLAARLGALTDSVPREGEPDRLLVNADRNPNSNGARLTGISFTEAGIRLPRIADGIRAGTIRTLVVFGEDVTQHGIGADLLARLELLVASDILPNATTAAAHFVLPGCAHAEKRGTFVNAKGRVQRFLKAIEPKGDARPESEFLREILAGTGAGDVPATAEGLFDRMAAEVPGLAGLRWSQLGDGGANVPV